MSHYAFNDLFDVEQVRNLMAAHYRATGIPASLVDVHGEVLVAVGWQDICVNFHRVHPVSCERCRESDRDFQLLLCDQLDQLSEYRCQNGLRGVAVPIRIAGKLLASLFLGQFFYQDDEIDIAFFRRQAEQYAFDEAAYLDALRRVSIFSRERVTQIMEFFRALADILVDMGEKNLQLHRDAEERRKIEQALRDSQTYLQQIYRQADLSIWVYNRDMCLSYVSNIITDMTRELDHQGCLLGHSLLAIYHDRPNHPSRQAVLQAISGISSRYDYQSFRDGKTQYVENNISPLRDEAGQIIGALGISVDITARKSAEKALEESQRSLKTLLSNLPGMAYRCKNDRDWTMEFVSEGCLALCGYSADELTNGQSITWGNLIVSEDRIAVWEAAQEAIAQQRIFRVVYRITKRDGTRQWVWEQGQGVFGSDGALCAIEGLIIDIADRMRAEEALRESESRYRTLFETAPLGIFRTDLGGKLIDINPSYARLFGYDDPKELIDLADRVGNAHAIFAHPEERSQLLERVYHSLVWLVQEIEYHRKDGSPLYGRLHMRAIRDAKGQPLFIEGFIEDISERFTAEEAMRRSETRLREIIDNAPMGIFQSTVDDQILQINPAYAHIFGYDSPQSMVEELKHVGVAHTIYADPDLRPVRVADAVQSGHWQTVNNVYHRKDGSLIYGRLHFRAVKDAAGQVQYLEGFVEDETERHLAEVALQENQRRLTTMMSNLPGMVYRCKNDYRWTMEFVSEGSRSLCGYAPEELIDNRLIAWADLLEEESHQDNWRATQEQIDKHHQFHFTYPIISRDGARKWVLDIGTGVHDVDGRLLAIEGFITDITDRVEAERALAESERRFRHLTEYLFGIVFRYELWPHRGFSYVSPPATEIVGYTPEEHYAEADILQRIIHPDDRELIWWIAGAVPRENGAHVLRCARRDGKIIWLELRYTPISDDSGNILAVEGIALDVTERWQTEQERLLLSRAIEQAEESVIIADPSGTAQYLNAAFERYTGYSRQEMLGQSTLALVSPAMRQDYLNGIQYALQSGMPWSEEILVQRKDGATFSQATTIASVFDASGRPTHFVIIGRDITEQEKLQVQLRQAQKMEAVGQLAGGVAHDFNNLLQVITGFTEMALMNLPEKEAVQADLAQVQKASERASVLVHQLLAFSRRQTIKTEVLDLNEIITTLMKMLRRLIGEHIDLELQLGYGSLMAPVDRGQIEQVLLNLCVNSRDAMPNGGRLTIVTQRQYIEGELQERLGWETPGAGIMLSINDTGVGIPLELQDRIFEPFFTTKEVGKGTGLGLATAYGIIKQHLGAIVLESEVGRGSTFRVYLPAAGQTVERSEEPVGLPVGSDGSELILFAEDDEMVRALTIQILSRAGYRVLEARDGIEALALFQKHADEIDLALLDVVMPRLGGAQVFRQIRADRPALPVLFASGYSSNVLDELSANEQSYSLIQKPYAPQLLLRRLRALLDGRPAI